MATTGKLHFSLVSPERALYSGEVDQVVVPGVDGQFGVLSQHAPFMTVIQQGAIRILDGQGLTILAEDAVDLANLDTAGLEKDLQNAREDARDAKDPDLKAAAERKLARLEAIRAAA
jgi:F-type H+-transporting ATPase subunit epsilon